MTKKSEKGGKKKKSKVSKEPSEPNHDPIWEKSVDKSMWMLGPERLPDPEAWPTFGALRERILMAAKEVLAWSNLF